MDLLSFDSTWLLAAICVLLLVSLFSGKMNISNSYWKNLGIPYIPRKPFVGSAMIFGIKEAHKTDWERYKKYGKLIGTYEAQQPVLLLGDPDIIRQIWVKDFPAFPGRRSFATNDPLADNMISLVTGEQWKRIRCIVTPAFATGKIKKMTDIIINSAQVLAKNFASKDGAIVDAKKLFNTFTMDVIASAAFATKIHSHTDPNNQFIQNAQLVFSRTISWRIILFGLFPQLVKALRIRVFSGTAMDFFKETILEIIEHRNKTGTTRNDFLQLMMDAEKEFRENGRLKPEEATEQKYTDDKNAEEFGHEEGNVHFLRAPKITKFLSQDELIAQSVIFFLAGFDTTASTLAYASHSLALNPDVQKKLQEDVDSVLKQYDGKLTYDGIQDMKYLDYVMSETLRFYPPATRIERMADVDYTLGDTGIKIRKGTVVAVPLYALHHDPEFYEEPEKFIPERFTPEEKGKRHPYAYLPFGAGPRNCVAMRFALMEVKLCLAYIISQFNIVECADTRKSLDIFSGGGLLSPANVMMRFEKRTDRVFDGL